MILTPATAARSRAPALAIAAVFAIPGCGVLDGNRSGLDAPHRGQASTVVGLGPTVTPPRTHMTPDLSASAVVVESHPFAGLTERDKRELPANCTVARFRSFTGGGRLADNSFGLYAEIHDRRLNYRYRLQEVFFRYGDGETEGPENMPKRFKNDYVSGDEWSYAVVLRCATNVPPEITGSRLISTTIGGWTDEGQEPCKGVVIVGERELRVVRYAKPTCP